MLERFMHAALMTFLLYLIAGLNAPNQISTKAASSQVSAPVISSTFQLFK
jgi:hypothetical protein